MTKQMIRGAMMGLALLALAAAGPAAGQDPEEPAGTGSFEEVLYPPELIMEHGRAIALTDRQRDEISEQIADLQGRVVRLQWELADRMTELTSTVRRPRVDLDLALDQLEATLETEKAIKLVHLEALIRIKNVLTPEQQARLDRLRATR